MRKHLEVMQQRQSSLGQADSTEAHKAAPLPPADMIIYANAATASTVTRRTIKEWGKFCKEPSDSAVCSAHPFWLAFTSTGDFATGLIMPIANAVFPAITSDGFHLISAANTPWLHTHEVREVDCVEHQKPTDYYCAPGVKAEGCFGGIRDEKKYCYEVTRLRIRSARATFLDYERESTPRERPRRYLEQRECHQLYSQCHEPTEKHHQRIA
jgi:hypothetical protein